MSASTSRTASGLPPTPTPPSSNDDEDEDGEDVDDDNEDVDDNVDVALADGAATVTAAVTDLPSP